METYRSGRNGAHSKCVCRETDTGVRIPPSPPSETDKNTLSVFILSLTKNIVFVKIKIRGFYAKRM